MEILIFNPLYKSIHDYQKENIANKQKERNNKKI